jgi:hypothetical protein
LCVDVYNVLFLEIVVTCCYLQLFFINLMCCKRGYFTRGPICPVGWHVWKETYTHWRIWVWMIGKIDGDGYGYGMILPVAIPALPSLWGTVGPRTTNKKRTTQIGWIGMAGYQLFFFLRFQRLILKIRFTASTRRSPHLHRWQHAITNSIDPFRKNQFNRPSPPDQFCVLSFLFGSLPIW